ncbi:glycosyltransferase [Clostridium saccharobutylicum]|uniref:Putative teichuronic acid biosynthesis glycosyltransferase TuaC n=1 Tax=Clostridium saccharobutylicum TaxID=169679 RepID=A0A1S8NAK2_CLOSA|nr:glycosyltransferase [Clostridium saccharobutylicum]OOM13516.1 putative teichuronic acid biosynthesis glycosyltransferase TuaC [Clostridium saccharobutylicum]
MHIMVIPSWYSSPRNKVHGSFFKEQFKALANSNEKITVAYNEIWPITMFGKVDEKRGISFNIEDDLRTYRYKDYNYFPKNSLMFKSFNKRMDKLYQEILKKEGKVDIIHAHSAFWGGIAATYISKKYNIPLVLTEHSSLKYAKYVKESYKKYIYNAYENADCLIAVGSGLKREIQKYVDRDIRVIHNMVDLKLFYIDECNENNELKINSQTYLDQFNNKPSKLKMELLDIDKEKTVSQKKENEFKFFSCAFLEEGKGMEDLIKAFTESFRDENVTLKIGGDGSLKMLLEKLIKTLNMEKQIKLLGSLSRERVSEEMRKCDAFALPSEHETFGVVYIEALACGKPVIGANNGGAEDIIKDYNGIIAKKSDISDLSNALRKIKDNYKTYDKYKIREKTILSYSEKVLVEKLKGVYKEVYERNN